MTINARKVTKIEDFLLFGMTINDNKYHLNESTNFHPPSATLIVVQYLSRQGARNSPTVQNAF